MTEFLPWILFGLSLAGVAVMVVLLVRERRRNGSLGNQAQDLARSGKDATVRETNAAVEEARELADEKVRRAEMKLEEARDADGNLADYIHDGGGS